MLLVICSVHSEPVCSHGTWLLYASSVPECTIGRHCPDYILTTREPGHHSVHLSPARPICISWETIGAISEDNLIFWWDSPDTWLAHWDVRETSCNWLPLGSYWVGALGPQSSPHCVLFVHSPADTSGSNTQCLHGTVNLGPLLPPGLSFSEVDPNKNLISWVNGPHRLTTNWQKSEVNTL